jgi:CubicO group peptidase (beta-lactamase class C family)
VIHKGQLVYERYAGEIPFFDRQPEPVQQETTQLSWSMAKSMTQFLVGVLADEGRLSVDDPAPVAAWQDDARRDITLRDLLAMRDGLDFVEEYLPDRPSDVIEMLFGSGRDDVASYAISRPLAYPPGTRWNYSSGTTNIVCRILADIVGDGEQFTTFMNERLFAPLGMKSAIAKCDARGTFVGSSYVFATARDFAKFGYLYLRGGTWDGRRLIDASWVNDAQIPLSRDEESGTYYSQQWWVTGDEFGSYWANGYEGQSITVVPALDAVVVRLGKTDASLYPALRAWRHELLLALASSTN